MNTIERRFEQLRQVAGYSSASARLLNAAFLLQTVKEFEAAHAFHDQLQVIVQAFRVEAGHKVVNFLRYKKRLPPLSYRSVLRRAAKELGLSVLAKDDPERIEAMIVTRVLGLREPWDPVSPAHRERLTAELNRAFRELNLDLKAKLTRALTTGLTLSSLRKSIKGMPKWAKPGSAAGLIATGIYGAYKLGEPDYSKSVLPTILLFALARADLELALSRTLPSPEISIAL